MADQLGLSADQPQPPPMLSMHVIIHPEATQVGHETDQPRQPSSAHPIALQNPPIPIQQAAPFDYYQQSPHAPNPNFYYDDPLVSQHLSGRVLDQTTEMGILHHRPSVLPGGDTLYQQLEPMYDRHRDTAPYPRVHIVAAFAPPHEDEMLSHGDRQVIHVCYFLSLLK